MSFDPEFDKSKQDFEGLLNGIVQGKIVQAFEAAQFRDCTFIGSGFVGGRVIPPKGVPYY